MTAAPPALADFVGWTIPDMCAAVEPLGLTREARPAATRAGEWDAGGKPLVLEADGWLVADGRMTLRAARIRTAKVDVGTVMCCPTTRPDQLPVIVADWVVFGPTFQVIALDVEVCGDQPALVADLGERLRAPAARWQPAFEAREQSAWFQSISQPWAIHAAAPADRADDVRQAFADYLAAAVPLIAARVDDVAAGPDHPDVRAYKLHHRDHSPAGPLLSRWMTAAESATFLDAHFGVV